MARKRLTIGRARAGVLAVAGALLALACFSAPAVAQPALGGQWHMDTLDSSISDSVTTPDSSGNGEDLVAGANAGVTVVPGRFQNAIAFEGATAFSTPGTPALEPAQLTVMAWVRSAANSPGPGAFKYIAEDGADGTCNAASYGLYTGSSGGVQFFVWTLSGPAFSSQALPSTVWDGNWHAIAGTYDGSAVHLYVDGNEVGSGTPTTQPIDYGFNSERFFVGDYPCQNFVFNGAIDELRVYDGALTASEVNQLQTTTGDTPPVLQEPPPPPPPTTTTTTTPTPTGGGLPPVARFTPAGASQLLKGGVWLNAGASFARKGTIVNYAWDPNGTGDYTDPCGTSPIASLQYKRPGAYTVGLQVTDSSGAVSTTSQQVIVTKSMTNAAALADTTFDCENPAAGGNQPSTADCVKTFAWSIIEVNSRGNPDDCFHITSRKGQRNPLSLVARDASSPRLLRSPGLCAYDAYGCDYHASIKGPVALNGLYIPMSEKFSTVYDTGTGDIGIGTLPLRLGPFGTQQLDLSKQLQLQTLQDDTCYQQKTQGFPLVPSGLLQKSGDIGGLPVQGGVEIDLLDHKSRTILNVGLPNIFTAPGGTPIQGKVCLDSDNVNGVSFEGVKVSVPAAFIGPIILQNLSFTYNKDADLWEGGAMVVLPPSGLGLDASPTDSSPDLGFGIRHGQFDHAGLGIDFPPGAQPELFTGVFLSNVHLAFGINPVRLTGGIGLNAAQIVNINGDAFVAAASADDPYFYPVTTSDLAPLSGKTFTSTTIAVAGNASARVPVLGSIPLANGYLLYEYPDYFEFGGGVSFEPPFLKLSGTMSGFLDPGHAFDLEGKLSACLRDVKLSILGHDFDLTPCFDTGAIISSNGIAFCGTVPVPAPFGVVIPVEITVGYHWGDSLPSIVPFSCKTSDYHVATTHSAHEASAGASFRLPSHMSSAAVRLTGAGGAPDAVLTGPGGETISTANAPGGNDVIVLRLPSANETIIGIRDPKGGRWSVAPSAGGTPVTSVSVAQALPPANVHVRITGSGPHRMLRYRLTRGIGRAVTLIERGPGVHHVLGRVTAGHGTLHFTPAPGRGGRRQIVAEILQDGLMISQSVVGSYLAPGEARPAAPSRVKVTHRGMRLQVRWARVPGAAEYLTVLMLPGRRRDLEITRGPQTSFSEVPPSVGGRVQVIAVSTMNLRGRPARAAFKGLPPPRPPVRRRHRHR